MDAAVGNRFHGDMRQENNSVHALRMHLKLEMSRHRW